MRVSCDKCSILLFLVIYKLYLNIVFINATVQNYKKLKEKEVSKWQKMKIRKKVEL